MSHVGQERPNPPFRAMSAVTPIATAIATSRSVAKCQNRTSCTAANGIVIPVTSWGSRSRGGVHLAWIRVTKFSNAEYTLARVFDTGFDR